LNQREWPLVFWRGGVDGLLRLLRSGGVNGWTPQNTRWLTPSPLDIIVDSTGSYVSPDFGNVPVWRLIPIRPKAVVAYAADWWRCGLLRQPHPTKSCLTSEGADANVDHPGARSASLKFQNVREEDALDTYTFLIVRLSTTFPYRYFSIPVRT
jgi:hypothetical protein